MVPETNMEGFSGMFRKIAGAALCAFTGFVLCAQVEVLPDETQKEWLSVYQTERAKAGTMQTHLKALEKKSDKLKINAARIAKDFEKIRSAGPVLHYAVDPMSETQFLPDVYPFDGQAGAPVRIIAAQDEYEPGSFLLYPLKNLGKVQFEVSDLKTADGAVFSRKDLDLKTVKVWYQNGNGWYSYFQDKKLKLCPELLLNDEDLIKVDTENVCNWARLTEKNGTISYKWLNPPPKADTRAEDAPHYRLHEVFCCMKPNFADAKDFKGATLNEGEFKQFFLTAHVKTGQKPGLYKGAVTLKIGERIVGTVPVELRVLPFVLPKPKTYQDPEKDYLCFMYYYISFFLIEIINGNDHALAEKQLISLLKNFAEHGETMPHYSELVSHPEFARTAGCDLSQMFVGGTLLGNMADMKFDLRRKNEDFDEKFGKHEGLFLGWGDEYLLSTLQGVRAMAKIYQEAGYKFQGNCRDSYTYGAYFIDLFNPPETPDMCSAAGANRYASVNKGGYYGWYASQHVGVENPAFIRRQYGFGPYRAGFSCHFNYAHHLDGYNDLAGDGYRPMNFVYGDGNGVINTLSYEAFREGMDDIRYATLLQQLARPLANSKNMDAAYAARKALQVITDMDHDDYDVSTARLEIIRHILNLQTFGK